MPASPLKKKKCIPTCCWWRAGLSENPSPRCKYLSTYRESFPLPVRNCLTLTFSVSHARRANSGSGSVDCWIPLRPGNNGGRGPISDSQNNLLAELSLWNPYGRNVSLPAALGSVYCSDCTSKNQQLFTYCFIRTF